MCMTQRHRESACEKIPHSMTYSKVQPSLIVLLSPLLLLHNVFVFGDNIALILHCCNPVKKTAKILAQIRKAVALIKAAASSCYAHSHKLKKRKHPAFSQFFSAQIGKKKNAMIIFTQPREGRGVLVTDQWSVKNISSGQNLSQLMYIKSYTEVKCTPQK